MTMWLPTSPRQVARKAFVALLLLASVWLALALTRVPSGVASLWAANGILLGILLRRPSPRWPLLFTLGWIANVLPRLWLGEPVALVAGLATINLMEVAFMAFAIRGRVPDIDEPSALLPLAKVATLSAVVACLGSATAAAALRSAFGSPFGEVWITWFCAHLLGVVITGTLVVVALHERPMEFNPTQLVMSETQVAGVLAYLPEDFDAVIAAMAEGLYDTTGWVREIELADVVSAIEDLRAGKAMKVLVSAS